jgi:hypothetical protein
VVVDSSKAVRKKLIDNMLRRRLIPGGLIG